MIFSFFAVVFFFFVFQPGFVASVAFVGWAVVALAFFTCLSIYLSNLS